MTKKRGTRNQMKNIHKQKKNSELETIKCFLYWYYKCYILPIYNGANWIGLKLIFNFISKIIIKHVHVHVHFRNRRNCIHNTHI